MSTDYTVVASADIDAPPDRVYAIIADYRNGHPHILPRAFRNLTVEKGGVGAGTIIRFEVRALGQTQRFRAFVTEPAEMTSRKGLAGALERFVSTRVMKKMYAEELALLAARARQA